MQKDTGEVMNQPDQNYDFENTPFNLSEPPPSIPMDQIESDTLAPNPDDKDALDQMAADNASPSAFNQVADMPSHVEKEVALGFDAENASLVLTDFSVFLNEKYADLNKKATLKNPSAPPLGHDSIFEKNIQSQWFVEYNQIKTQSAKNEDILLCKPNGFFYSDRDTVEKALKDYGFEENSINQLAPHLQFTFIGNTEIRGNKAKGVQRTQFKTFVMQLKDSSTPESKDIMAAIVAQKTQHVQQYLDKNYDLDKAKTKILGRVDDLISTEVANTGVQPFVGVGPALFLNSSAVYEKMAQIPEIKDKFRVEPLDVNGNKITYTGFSEGLNSYFNSDLKLHKITTKNPDLLSQADLEGYIKEHLKDEVEPLLIAPQHDDNRIIQKQHDKLDQANDSTVTGDQSENKYTPVKESGENKKPPNEKQIPHKEDMQPKQEEKTDKNVLPDDEEDEKKRKRKRENDDENEKSSLAEIAIKAAQKITEAALKALLRLAQIIAMLIIALLKAILSFGSRKMTEVYGTKPYFQGPSMLSEVMKTNFADNLFQRKNNGKASTKEQANDIQHALDSSLTDKKEKTLDFEQKNDLSEKLANLGVGTTFDPLKDAESKLALLGDDKKIELDALALEKLNLLTDDQKNELLDTLNIPTTHKLSDVLESKLTPKLMYSEAHGVLLGKGDEVALEDGSKAGIVSAYNVGGKLFYAIASESEDKNYKLDYVSADELTLTGHNIVNFDNEANLIQQANDSIDAKANDLNEGKIEPVELLNHDKPQESAITIAELVSKIPLVSHDTMKTMQPIDFLTEYENSTIKKQIEEKKVSHQLHNDKTDSLTTDDTHGQQHAYFGKILDFNDTIEATLPHSGMPVSGSINGAYTINDQLYYKLQTDKNIYNIAATDVTLTQVNGGDLDNDINELLSKQKENTVFSNGHEAAKVFLLSHKDASHKYNEENNIKKGNQHRLVSGTHALSDVGLKPFLKDENGTIEGFGKIYSVDSNKGKRHFVSLGHIMDPNLNQKRAVGVEVRKIALLENGLYSLNASRAEIKEIDLDSPSVKDEQEAIPEKLEAFINKTSDLYHSVVNKAKASLVASFAKDAEAIFDKQSNAEQLYQQKQIASKLLADKALEFTNPENTINLGVDANLSQTQVNKQAIIQAIVEPESQKQLAGLDTVNDSAHKPNQLMPNSYTMGSVVNNGVGFDELNALINNPVSTQLKYGQMDFKYTAIPHTTLLQSIEQQNVVALETTSNEVVVDVQEKAEATSNFNQRTLSALDNVKKINSTLPESVLMRVALSYVTGDRLCNNQEGGIDLLTAREDLKAESNKIQNDIKQILPLIKPFVTGFDENGKINSIADIKVNDFDGLKKLLLNNQEASIRLDNISNKEAAIFAKLENHLDKVETRFDKINDKLDLNQFNTDNLGTLNSVTEEFISTIKNDYLEMTGRNTLVSLLNEIKNPNSEYGDISKKLVDKAADSNANLEDRLTSLNSSFQPKFKNQSSEYSNNMQKKNDSFDITN